MIQIKAATYVPFEPRTEEQRALRAQLRTRLLALEAKPGEVLYASFAGVLPSGAGVENALFYNLDASGVFASMWRGVSFEIAPSPPVGGVQYEYKTGPVKPTFSHWREQRPLATIDVTFDAVLPKLATIWWALRSAFGSIQPEGTARAPDELFTIAVSVQGPSRGLTPGLLKAVLDGIVCALQSEADMAQATAVAPLLAAALGVSPDAVFNALIDPQPSALGSRERFVHKHGHRIKWEPDDDRCVAARVLFSPAERWRVSGNIARALSRAPLGR